MQWREVVRTLKHKDHDMITVSVYYNLQGPCDDLKR